MYHGWQCLGCSLSSENSNVSPTEHQQTTNHMIVPTEGH